MKSISTALVFSQKSGHVWKACLDYILFFPFLILKKKIEGGFVLISAFSNVWIIRLGVTQFSCVEDTFLNIIQATSPLLLIPRL